MGFGVSRGLSGGVWVCQVWGLGVRCVLRGSFGRSYVAFWDVRCDLGVSHVFLGCQVSVWEDDFEGSPVGFLGSDVFWGSGCVWRTRCVSEVYVYFRELGVFRRLRCILEHQMCFGD